MSKIFISSIAAVALFAGAAVALEIENKDGKDFYVYIGTGTPNSTETVVIPAGKKVGGLCGDVCTISLEGEGQEMAVSAGEKVQINGGKLRVQ